MTAYRTVFRSILVLLLLILKLPLGVLAQASPQVDLALWSSRIAIVWPHDGQGRRVPVAESTAVNVSVWPRNPVPCTVQPDLSLMVAQNNEPTAMASDTYEQILRQGTDRRFPAIEFNGVTANLRENPSDRYAFLLYSQELPTRLGFQGNVWVHAADARTILPFPVPSTGYASATAKAYDARIQTVWPHDAHGQPAAVEDAPLVNITVHVFEHGTTRAYPSQEGETVPFDLVLLKATANGSLEPVDVAPAQEGYASGRRFFIQWTFNNVPVDPSAQTHFVVSLLPAGGGFASRYSTVWTHAADPRTILPNPEEPPACESTEGAVSACTISPLVVPLVVPWMPSPEATCRQGTAPDGAAVTVLALDADVDSVAPGDALVLSWETEGADTVILELYSSADIRAARLTGDDTVAPLLLLTDLPLRGSRTMTVPDGLQGDLRVVLWGARRSATALPSPARVAFQVLDLWQVR